MRIIEIEEDYVRKLLQELVACDTTEYKEERGQCIVECELQKLDCKVKRVNPKPTLLSKKYTEFNTGHSYENRDCLSAEFPGTGGGRSLIMNAHIDTVVAAQPQEWETDPYMPLEKDGKLYGLGTCDTKAGMAAMLAALRMLKIKNIKLKGNVFFHSVVDEEAGGGNGTLACIDEGDCADAVIVAEPTGLRPASAHIGSYAARLTLVGKSVHGNLKEAGINSIEKMFPLLQALYQLGHKWGERRYGLLPSPVLSVVSINTGEEMITLPGKCVALVNFTYLPDGLDYEREFLDTVREYERRDTWLCQHPILIEKLHDVRPYYMQENCEWGKYIKCTLS